MTYVKHDGEWNIPAPHIREDGVWKPICNAWIKENGSWSLYRSINCFVEYVVIGGGGGGGGHANGDPGGGGGGAGGYRTNILGETSGRSSDAEDPLILDTGIPYYVDIGGGMEHSLLKKCSRVL